MFAEAPTRAPAAKPAFPSAAVDELLRRELQEAVEESEVLHHGWEPVLDSLRMVTVVAAVEKLIGIRLPPEKVIRKGGYKDLDDGASDMGEKVRRIWNDR